jgi:hypothetical protein
MVTVREEPCNGGDYAGARPLCEAGFFGIFPVFRVKST